MKKMYTSRKVNRNNNSFNPLSRKASHHTAVSPEILVGQIWLQEDEPAAIEIIELNTSDEFVLSPDEAQGDSHNHAWRHSNVDRLQQIEDNYKINMKARERRRKNFENHLMNTSTNTNNHFMDNLYNDNPDNHMNENKLNHQVNCFTIINKHFINSDTSSDAEFADVEIITSNDITMEPNNWDARRPYEEEIITYDPELGNETRTIWIYSFKNKHLLQDGEYEPANMGAKETSSRSTSCSIESDEEQTKDKSTNTRRLGSPIPPSYIPRLNLSLGPTLSTVTEVSEPNKQLSSNGSNKSENKFQKQKNSWFFNDIEKLDSARSISKHEKSTNIVNWMGLSPREKRRRSKDPGDKWEGSLLKLEPLHIGEVVEMNEQRTNESGKDDALRLHVDVEVHVSVNEKSPDKRYLGTPNSTDVNVKSNSDYISPIKKIKNADADIKVCAKDRGDHDMKFETTQQVLFHKIPDNINDLSRICDEPVKNINNVTWELETKDEKETASYDFLTNKMASFIEEENNADTLWMKNNMPLLKPSQWNEYLPIAESPFSLHLSLGSIIEERQSWFKRFIRYMNCCK